jgi:hypothetical protein
MSTDSYEALFQQAVQERRQEKKREQERGSFGGGNREFPEYAALRTNGFEVVRLLGEPISMRREPTSPKIIHHTRILGDDDKKFRCIFPPKSEQPDWILWRIMGKVLDYTWDSSIGENGGRRYHHAESHPRIFNRVAKNSQENNKYETGWRPTRYVIYNHINRNPSVYQWHKENQKTLLLSKKGSEMKNGGIFYEPGVPVTLYNTLMEEIVEVHGDPNKYDVVIYKMDQDPFYKVYHPVDDYKRILAKFENENDLAEAVPGLDSDVSERPLTEEEKSWEMWNIDKHFPITSYRKIHNRLKSFIQSVDTAFGTHYLEELEDLVEQEKKERGSDDRGDEEDSPSETESKTAVTKEKEPTDNAPASRSRKRKKEEAQEDEGFSVDKIAAEHPELKGIDNLSPEEKAKIIDVDYDNNGKVKNFNYSLQKGEQLLKCVNVDEGCTMTSPDSFHYCPLCGEKFD